MWKAILLENIRGFRGNLEVEAYKFDFLFRMVSKVWKTCFAPDVANQQVHRRSFYLCQVSNEL